MAFEAERDCVVCHARSIQMFLPTYRVPNRAHHVLCIRNKSTKGKGVITEQNLANTVEEKRLKTLYAEPLAPAEKCRAEFTTAEAVNNFFVPKPQPKTSKMTTTTTTTTTIEEIDFGKTVLKNIEDSTFCQQHKTKSAPLAMIAFATAVVENIVRSKDQQAFGNYFSGLTMMVPHSKVAINNPQYHSIVGQKLLLVDWIKACGVDVPCPDANCNGHLNNVRTNFSKNKTLFPIFSLESAPAWCMVMKMTCSSCRRDFNSNDAAVLLTLPPHVAQLYPVDSKYALSNHSCHLAKTATNILDSIMLTYANGELCSRLLYNTINRDYVERITAYYSYNKSERATPNEAVAEYIQKDGGFLRQFPPNGDTIRDMYDEASSSSNTPWGVSDHERHTREIQGVECDRGIFAQDHTFSVVKNYQNRLGAKAVWDVATNTGEVATAVCVPSTQTIHFSHAARMLIDRPKFNPQAMYSDTWPHKKEYWEKLIPGVKGRLGLFHFEKRILSTLRKKHIDFYDALTDLLQALYEYDATDYENVLSALKNGTLSSNNKKFTTEDISDLQCTKYFRVRYGKYMRKQLREPNTMVQRLDDWFCKYKVTSSDPDARPARGRLDPSHNVPLFTSETKSAVENCKEKAVHLADPMTIDQMYDNIPPSPNSKHQLIEHISKRGESKLESFHDRLAHFANSGMRDSLSDNLHLAGTARYNLSIRYKRRLMTLENTQRSTLPAAWEKIVPYWNHTELVCINKIAIAVGCNPPFPQAETLPKDTGERFFSEYITNVKPLLERYNGDECWWVVCRQMINDEPTTTTYLTKPVASPTLTTTTTDADRQQQVHRQPKNHSVSVSVARPPTTTPTTQFTYKPWLPIMPMQMQMPFYCVPPTPAACCVRYMEWMQTRKGRPPHDRHCQNRGCGAISSSSNSTAVAVFDFRVQSGANGNGIEKNRFTI